MFIGVDAAGFRIMQDRLRVAVTEGEYLVPGCIVAHIGIVRRDGAVFIEADDSPEMVAVVLGLFAIIKAIAACDHETTIRQEGQAGTVMHIGGAIGIGFEHLFEVLQRPVGICAPAHHQRVALVPLGGIGEVDQPVGLEIRVQHDVRKSALPDGGEIGFGHTADRCLGQHAVINQPQLAGEFRYQHVTVRQKGDRPWMVKPFSNSFHGELPVRRNSHILG